MMRKISIFAAAVLLVLSAPSARAELVVASKYYVDSMAEAIKNVQPDWNQSGTGAKDFIKNKPSLGSAAAKNIADFVAAGQVPASTATANQYLKSNGTAGVSVWQTPDSAAVSGSGNLITSGAVYEITGNVAAALNAIVSGS
jgi:hypothetical protein